MKLLIKKELKKSTLKILISSTDFTEIEKRMIIEIGDPDFIISKQYGSYNVNFNRKLKASTITLRFEVDASTPESAKEVGDFFDDFKADIETEAERIMSDLKESYDLLGINLDDEYVQIDY